MENKQNLLLRTQHDVQPMPQAQRHCVGLFLPFIICILYPRTIFVLGVKIPLKEVVEKWMDRNIAIFCAQSVHGPWFTIKAIYSSRKMSDKRFVDPFLDIGKTPRVVHFQIRVKNDIVIGQDATNIAPKIIQDIHVIQMIPLGCLNSLLQLLESHV
jgi:hypothetical protein